MADSTRLVTWAALLGKWTDFARSAVALPAGGEGGRLRRSVPAVIALQSVTYALGELDSLPAEERPIGLDRAEILIGRHESELADIWKGGAMNPELAELVRDARSALAAAAKGRGSP